MRIEIDLHGFYCNRSPFFTSGIAEDPKGGAAMNRNLELKPLRRYRDPEYPTKVAND